MIPNLPFTCPPQLEAALRGAYATPPRAYHNFAHVEEVLEHMAAVPTWSSPIEVALAILFHDAIYEAGQPDNEKRSAELAEQWIASQLPEQSAKTERVKSLIELTAKHGNLEPSDVDPEAALFLDCDMAVLGSEPARYAQYEREIAEEFRALPPDLYTAGRAHFLRSLLAMPTIYLSPFFRSRLEARARDNIAKALRS